MYNAFDEVPALTLLPTSSLELIRSSMSARSCLFTLSSSSLASSASSSARVMDRALVSFSRASASARSRSSAKRDYRNNGGPCTARASEETPPTHGSPPPPTGLHPHESPPPPAGDDLPLVVQVHGEVVQLLLQTGLRLLHLLKSDGLLFQSQARQLKSVLLLLQLADATAVVQFLTRLLLEQLLKKVYLSWMADTLSNSVWMERNRGGARLPMQLIGRPPLCSDRYVHLQLVRSLGQFPLGPLALRDSGHDLLQLSLHFLPLVLRLHLGLLQTFDLADQLLVDTLLALLCLLQVGLELDTINNKHQ
ncbi:hypothetical protein EYF80_031173 [Liparis tanakae]|uniref:Uncharacterized protein n=1 Tax=Liparis tanakae TaxID=230148 RepID=A0A4Z2H0G4_9TELE|nr:hypothetical protein EYF80_031173 [Liparis tanakae]